MNIKVNTSKLSAHAENIDEYISIFSKGITNSKLISNNIKGAWSGDSYDNFKKEMDIFFGELVKLTTALKANNTFLKGYIAAETILDSRYSEVGITLK